MKITSLVLLLCSLQFAHAQDATSVAANAKEKIELVRKMKKYLGVDFGKNKDWSVDYLRGRDSSNKILNVEISDNFHGVINLTDAQIRKYAEEKIRNPNRYGGSLNPLESEYLQMSIKDTKYYHSWIGGNGSKEFATFNINMSDESQIIESLREGNGRLEAVTYQEFVNNGKRSKYYQRVVIDASSKPVKLKFSNWKPLRLEDTKTVTIESNVLHPEPVSTEQTFGI